MGWYGRVDHSAISYDMVWHGGRMVWYGLVWNGRSGSGKVWVGMVWLGRVW